MLKSKVESHIYEEMYTCDIWQTSIAITTLEKVIVENVKCKATVFVFVED